MNDHSGRLIHDEQGLVLIDHADRNVLARDDAFLDFWDLDAHYFAPLRPVAGFLAATVHHYVPLRYQRRGLGTRQVGVVGNKEVEADIAVRLDRKRFDVAQGLALRGRVRNWSGSHDGPRRSFFPPKDPGKQKCANAHGHVSDVEGWPPQVADPDVDEVHDTRR